MNSKSKKREKKSSAEDEALEQISEAFLDHLKNLPYQNVEAFDKYSDIIRMHFYSRLPNFEDRFIAGYHLLMREISSDN